VEIASDSRPLVMSLSTREAGAEADYEVIPKFMGRARAGGDALAANDVGRGLDQLGDMAFSFEWLRDNLGHTSGQLASIKVAGDSMASTLIDGETIIIDTSVNRVDVSGIYVITMRGDRLVKRIDRKLDDSLVIISDNPRYTPDVLPPGRAADLTVMGRMVWPRVR
jgi:phage repressor protein C with HTH and peptisase S24 domain